MSWQDEQFNRLFRLDPFVQQIQGMELARLMDRKERMGGMNDMDKGIYSKYIVTKADGTPLDGDCFVLRPDRDVAAVKALLAYAASTPNDELSSDIRVWLASIGADMDAPDETARLRADLAAMTAERDAMRERCEAAESGEEMHPADEWHEDHGCALWWLVPDDGSNIDEYPFCGNPLCSDWEDRPFEPTHYTRIRVHEPMRRGPAPSNP